MYELYFGFRQAPFGVTPDPRFLYRNRRYEEALSTLLCGIRERKGFVLLTGEIGTGKTTILHAVMSELLADTAFVLVFNAVADFDQLLIIICDQLGLTPEGADRPAHLAALNRFVTDQLRAGRTTALLIDEAQTLSAQTLEDLRLLSNPETPAEKQLQIVLVGQPELVARLAAPSLGQLRRRIARRCELTALSGREVADFVRHRLLTAGAADESVIAPNALAQIARLSGGIPRLVNMICDNALLVCYGSSQKTVTPAVVDEVADDLGLADPAFSAGRSLDHAAHEVERFTARTEPPTGKVFTTPRVASGIAGLVLFSAVAASISSRAPNPLRGSRIDGLRRAPSQGATKPPPAAPDPDAREHSKLPDSPAPAASVPVAVASPFAGKSVEVAPLAEEPLERPKTQPLPEAEAGPQPELARVKVHVASGVTLLQIVASAYGSYCRLGLDLVPPANPDIEDFDEVLSGRTLSLPPLERARLLRHDADGSLRLVVAAYFQRSVAMRVAQALRRSSGQPVEITRRPLSSNLALYRLEVPGLRDAADISRAWRHAREMDLVPPHLEAFGNAPTRSGFCQDPSE